MPPTTHRQYRIIVEEAGTPIYALTNLERVFRVLVDTISALQILHKYHYVHRDVSFSNVMVCHESGKLSDLECVVKGDAMKSHKIRTGVPDFTSVEAESQIYWFRPRHKKTKLAFHYNPLHDLESVWWLAVWFLFCHRIQENQQETDTIMADEQLRWARTLFPRRLGMVSRVDHFVRTGSFQDAFYCLPRSFLEAATTLEEARMVLGDHYEQAESGDEIDTAAFLGIHEELIRLFNKAGDSCRNVVLKPLISVVTEMP